MNDDSLTRRAADRTDATKAPEAFIPTGRWPLQQLVPEFEAARASTIEFAKATPAQLRLYSFANRRFGSFDCYQWLLLIPSHGDRHRAQAEEVIAHAGFPRAAKA